MTMVRKSVVVKVPVERAFTVFVRNFGAWWPRSFSIGASPLGTAVIEPKAGGRWYEIGEDGTECDWGEVLAHDLPQRLLLAWRIGADWRHDPALLTEVEVVFTPLGARETRVDLEHRLLENMGAAAAGAVAAFGSDRGWIACLHAFAGEAEGAR